MVAVMILWEADVKLLLRAFTEKIRQATHLKIGDVLGISSIVERPSDIPIDYRDQ